MSHDPDASLIDSHGADRVAARVHAALTQMVTVATLESSTPS